MSFIVIEGDNGTGKDTIARNVRMNGKINMLKHLKAKKE